MAASGGVLKHMVRYVVDVFEDSLEPTQSPGPRGRTLVRLSLVGTALPQVNPTLAGFDNQANGRGQLVGRKAPMSPLHLHGRSHGSNTLTSAASAWQRP